MLNMAATGGPAGFPPPQLNMQDGANKSSDFLGASKTNSETIAVVNTNHEGMIVSTSSSSILELTLNINLIFDFFFLEEWHTIWLLWN